MIEIKEYFSRFTRNGIYKFLTFIALFFFLVTFPMIVFDNQESKIEELEAEVLENYIEIQGLKQVLHMIEMRNEGIKYIEKEDNN